MKNVNIFFFQAGSFFVFAAALFSGAAERSWARPAVSLQTKYYSVTGTTFAELKAQMNKYGPKGFWAYTSWYVRWSEGCRVEVAVTYTLPRWQNQHQATAKTQEIWNGMIERLKFHEKGHAEHAISAGNEIERSGCRGDPRSIIQKWARQDAIYDRRTRHGIGQGVTLP